MITWQQGDTKRSATGRQLARMLTTASEKAPAGVFASGRDDAGHADPMLRGLADLVFPDARDSDHLKDETRYFITETMESLAAQIVGEQLDGDTWPARFTVHVRKGAGKRPTARRPAARSRGGAR